MAPPHAPIDLTANRNGEIIAFAVICTLLSLLTLGTRFWSRAITQTSWGVDDGFLTAAWAIAAAESIAIAAGTHFAKLGYPLEALDADDTAALMKLTYAVAFLHSTTLTLAKLSILILFHHIFVTRRFRVTLHVLTGIVVVWWIATLIAGTVLCFLSSRHLQPYLVAACGNQDLFNIIAPIPWVVTDFAILVAPIPVIRQLQMTAAKRWRVYAVFMLGGITCIISAIRYVHLLASGEDFPETLAVGACLLIVEAHVSILCPALIASKPALTYLVPERLRVRFRRRDASPKLHELHTLAAPKVTREGHEESHEKYVR